MSGSFPTLKLWYFDVPARAHVIRVALAIGGVPFDDHVVSREEWPAVKPSLPFEQMPVLEVDGHVFAQSHAIERYVGRLAGLYPFENALESLQVDEIVDAIEDINQLFVPSRSEPDVAKKKAMRQALGATDVPKMFRLLETRLQSSTAAGPWYLDKMSIADVAVYAAVVMIKTGFTMHIPTTICDQHPRMLAIYKAIDSHPNVVARYGSCGL
ncbi:hypothetical protein H310_02693 [Aphanomyces invadans]|uniref:Glutathione S-transferase n=1 Tax=Aphanomyces invadans TaxID=157072 RepID=A0A024UKT1_9STRA|nr:hypothetical protein H310_02693 [Aphanomyces invadans]ETW06437.1 hypothetical protein H310_02693 [Aphanomyces invadans]|eukprot:XP_008864512.1 hypothetical protein H310_02693 [Aphanomyces invadans]